jgi:capsular exopolysaccharide synthesis family protein
VALLPAGPAPPNPSELLASKRIRDLIEQLKAECDYLLVDSPPVLPVTDALVLATMVDATILVGRADKTTRKEIHRSVELLQQVDAPLVGTVLNGVNPEATYGYGAGYGYGSAAAADSAAIGTLSPADSVAENGNGRRHGARTVVHSAFKRNRT